MTDLLENVDFREWFENIPIEQGGWADYEIEYSQIFLRGTNQNKTGLNNTKDINIFIGANNSGKSRFMREIIKRNLDELVLEKLRGEFVEDLHRKYENVLRKQLFGLTGSYKTKIESIWSSGEKSNWIQKFNTMSSSLEKIKTTTMEIDPTAKKNEILEATIECLSLLKSPLNPLKVKKIYFPIIRGLRPLRCKDISRNKFCENNANDNDVYCHRTMNDYFEKKQKQEQDGISDLAVFTGLNIYQELKEKLLGHHKDREKVREFEKFLSDEFFDSKSITLVPRIEKDVVYVKIGDEEERPIYELGDGIQSIIILTFPLFMRQDEYLLVFMEEPEMYMHPGLQRRFLERLKAFDKMKFFITTHSNHFLDTSIDIAAKDVSIYNFQKKISEGESTPKFFVRNVKKGGNEILDSIGVKNGSVFLANCSIWVEGITDRIYIRAYLDAYQKEKGGQKFKEDVNFSFFEYGGANIVHYEWSDEETENIKAHMLSNRVFLIADQDGPNKIPRHEKFKEMANESDGKFHYEVLEVREIENLLTKDDINKAFEKDNLSLDAFKEEDFRKEYIGKYIRDVCSNSNFSKKVAKSDTLKSDAKVKLANSVKSNIEWSKMSEPAKTLVEKVYQFIEKNNQ